MDYALAGELFPWRTILASLIIIFTSAYFFKFDQKQVFTDSTDAFSIAALPPLYLASKYLLKLLVALLKPIIYKLSPQIISLISIFFYQKELGAALEFSKGYLNIEDNADNPFAQEFGKEMPAIDFYEILQNDTCHRLAILLVAIVFAFSVFRTLKQRLQNSKTNKDIAISIGSAVTLKFFSTGWFLILAFQLYKKIASLKWTLCSPIYKSYLNLEFKSGAKFMGMSNVSGSQPLLPKDFFKPGIKEIYLLAEEKIKSNKLG